MLHVGIQDTMASIPVGLANMTWYLQRFVCRQRTKGLVEVSKGTLKQQMGHKTPVLRQI